MLRDGNPTTYAVLAVVPQAARASPAARTPVAARHARRTLIDARLIVSLFLLRRMPLRRCYLMVAPGNGRSRRHSCSDPRLDRGRESDASACGLTGGANSGRHDAQSVGQLLVGDRQWRQETNNVAVGPAREGDHRSEEPTSE